MSKLEARIRMNGENNWKLDYQNRCNPELMNQLLHQAVPVLKACDWKITKVEKGLAESILPLNQATTNQHGTHQAALISLSADYTGGMALATLLENAPLAGIHKCTSDDSASLWLVAMNVKYLKPSTGHLLGKCQIPEDTIAKVCKRYRQGKRVLVSLPIEFFSNGEMVAEAELKYFAQPTRTLLNSVAGKRSSLFAQKIKASARMIAGIRALDDSNLTVFLGNGKQIRIDDGSWNHAIAGPHGMLLARKMTKKLPELVDFIRVRTKHIDSLIQNSNGLEQLVLVGAGLDMRAFRHAQVFPNLRVFELDLPEMLEERERVLQRTPRSSNRHAVAIDFLNEDIAARLRGLDEFDEYRQTVFVYEGCSMYFDRESNERILKSLNELMKHPSSNLWVDFVNEEIAKAESKNGQVISFLNAMEDLGEKFIFGSDHPLQFLREIGFEDAVAESTFDFLNAVTSGRDKPCTNDVFRCYRMCIAR